jgi:hypothetical protein
VWVADADTAGARYLVRARVNDKANHLLDVTDTKPFLKLTPAELRDLAAQKPMLNAMASRNLAL